MRGSMRCDTARERLAAYREGWLTEADRAAMARHLAACPDCAEEARLDARLCRALGALPAEPPPPAVEAAERRAPPAATRRRPVFAPGLLAAAVLLLLWLGLRGIGPPEETPGGQPVTPGTPAAAAKADIPLLADAHMVLTAADTTGDPNRAILLLHAAQTGPGEAR